MLNYEKNLEEAQKLVQSIELKQDPLSSGNLSYFNNLFEQIQSARDRILHLIIEAIWNKSAIQSELAVVQNTYNEKLSQILSRAEIIELKSDKLRMAVAERELSNEIKLITDKERESTFADAYHKSLLLIYEELKSKNNNLEQQFLTVRAMISIDPAVRDMVLANKINLY